MLQKLIELFSSPDILLEFSLIFIGAAVLSTLFLYIKQPIILAYIVLGIIIGPFGIGLINNAHDIEEISHLGIIFLMFLLGSNLHPNKLITLFKTTFFVTIVTCLSTVFVLSGLSILFGFDGISSIIIGISLMFSSTIIGIKLLPTTTLHQQHVGERVISVLLLQDIIAIITLIFLYGIDNTQNNAYLLIGTLIIKLILLTIGTLVCIKYIVLPIIRKFSIIQDYMFLVSLGWCLGIAQIASLLGLSYEIGAFIAGLALATSPISRVISEGLKPLREFFLILFFFSIGASFSISSFYQVLPLAILLAIVVVGVKLAVFYPMFLLSKERKKDTKDLSIRLSQASEFSLLIAFGAAAAGKITGDVALLIQTITMCTFIISTYCTVWLCETPIATNKKLRKD